MERVEDELVSRLDGLALLVLSQEAKTRRELRAWFTFGGLCGAGLIVIGWLTAGLVR